MSFFVYIIKSIKHHGLYKGFTDNLSRRLNEHNSGKSKYTSRGIPWILVYFETHESLKAAIAREKYFKSAAGRRFLKKLVLDVEVRVPRPTEWLGRSGGKSRLWYDEADQNW